ncbi:MAG: hypothetical protein JJU13_05530 [Balneolaceae bacterium]|nr:hypothetical protein [Balneolaceae bacterium]
MGQNRLWKILPLSAYGFRIYDAHEVQEMLITAGFTHLSAETVKDQSESVDGKKIEREFVVVGGKKEDSFKR